MRTLSVFRENVLDRWSRRFSILGLFQLSAGDVASTRANGTQGRDDHDGERLRVIILHNSRVVCLNKKIIIIGLSRPADVGCDLT